MKLLEGNIRKMLLHLELCNDFSGYDINSTSNKTNLDTRDDIRLKNFCTVKEMTN